MLAGRNEKFPPANILSFLPSHYNDVHAFVSSTEHGFFRILGEMLLRGQEKYFLLCKQNVAWTLIARSSSAHTNRKNHPSHIL